MNAGDLVGVVVLVAGIAVAAVVIDKRKERERLKKEANHTND